MPHPVRLGSLVYADREYVVLRLHTDSGLTGNAFGYTRLAPVGEELRALLPAFIGRDPLQHRVLRADAEGALSPARGSFLRALSLVDIALWDIAAKHAGLPLWALLGGARRRIPLIAVAGYFADVKGPQAVLEEVAGLGADGYRVVKIMLDGADPAADATFAADAAASLPEGSALAIDFHASWSSVGQAWHTCRLIDDLGLRFIEDPFHIYMAEHYRALAARLRTPLAAGEDAVYLENFQAVMPAIGYLRLDASVSTGITDALTAIGMARLAGREVIPHVFAPLHAPLAAAFREVAALEWIDPACGADPWHRLLREPPQVERGELIPSGEPGIGFAFDWDAVRAYGTCSEIRG
jgi:L-alanine-DL-glutamate epimerase-like enolase superfamily enzyme